MNADTLTTPSPELKQHTQDLRRDAGLVAKDVKNQAAEGLEQVKAEAASRIQEARGTAADLYDSARSFVAEHPLGSFCLGVVAGILLARRTVR